MAPELQSITGEPPPIFGRFFSSDSSEISVHMRKRWVLLQIIRLMFNSIWVFLKFENSTLSSLIFLGYSVCCDVKSWFLPSALLMCFFLIIVFGFFRVCCFTSLLYLFLLRDRWKSWFLPSEQRQYAMFCKNCVQVIVDAYGYKFTILISNLFCLFNIPIYKNRNVVNSRVPRC